MDEVISDRWHVHMWISLWISLWIKKGPALHLPILVLLVVRWLHAVVPLGFLPHGIESAFSGSTLFALCWSSLSVVTLLFAPCSLSLSIMASWTVFAPCSPLFVVTV